MSDAATISFEETGLKPEILSAIEKIGFVEPTPIQQATIPALLNGNEDIIALAQTGTGKTAAFGLPLVQLCSPDVDFIQALILCPTRELAIQIGNDLEDFAANMKRLSVTCVYGGADIQGQIRSLKRKPQIVVGTPGRTLDLIKRKVLKIDQLRTIVLDEADEMLNMGFKEDLDAILASTPDDKQSLLFSATMPKEIARITKKYMDDPIEISVGTKNAGADNIDHDYYVCQARNRYKALKRLVDINPGIYAIVFCRTRLETKKVAGMLMEDGYNADALQGEMSQAQRSFVMNRFKEKQLQILVATDVAARGLDVNDLTHVINYNLPDENAVYIHRSGRTGRAGKSGICISILTRSEERIVRNLERLTHKSFTKKLVPSGHEVCEKQLFNLIDRVEKVDTNQPDLEPHLPVILKKLEGLDKEDLIRHFVTYEFRRFLEYYKNAPDLNELKSDRRSRDRDDDGGRGRGRDKDRGDRGDRGGSRGRDRDDRSGKRNKNSARGVRNWSRIFINIGSQNKMNATNLIGLINDNTQNRDIHIGKIDIQKKHTFFEVESEFAPDVVDSFSHAKYKGNKVSVELSLPRTESKTDKTYHKKKEKKKKHRKGKNPGKY